MNRQQEEYINESFDDVIRNQHVIQIKQYQNIELDRYWFDITQKRVLLYMPTKKKFKVLKGSPVQVNNKRYSYFGLIDVKGKTKTKSYDRFIKHLIDCLCDEDEK